MLLFLERANIITAVVVRDFERENCRAKPFLFNRSGSKLPAITQCHDEVDISHGFTALTVVVNVILI